MSEEDALLAELARVAHDRDPVPAHLIAMAKDCFTWGTVDAELASVLWDSGAEQGVRVRSANANVRLLSFATPHLNLELEILESNGRCRVVGELTPAVRARVLVEHRDGMHEDLTDEHGRFLLADLPRGPIKLRCEPSTPGAAALVTAWLDL